MKRYVMIGIVCLTLSVLAAGAQAQFVVESLHREASAGVMDLEPPYDRTEDGQVTTAWGSAALAGSAIRDDSSAQASQATDASWSASAIIVTGTQHAEVARTGSGAVDQLWGRNLVMIRFDNPDPFIMHVEWEKTEYPAAWIVAIDDLMLGDGAYRVLADDLQGSVTIACSGSGFYRLYVEHLLSRNLAEPGERAGDLTFAITLAPEGTIPSREETWSGVMALYR